VTWGWAEPLEEAAHLAAADTGVSVVPWHDWAYAGHGATQGALRGTMWHDTVSPYSWSDAQLLRLLRQGYTGLPGPIANVGIGPTGNILLVAAGRAYHAGAGRWAGIASGNLNAVGIEVSNDGRQAWRPLQLVVARQFTHHLHRLERLDADTLVGHKEWAPRRKRDPHSVRMATERAMLRDSLIQPEEDLLAAYEAELAAIALNTNKAAREAQRQSRLQAALVEAELARFRADLGMKADPKSDAVWSERIADDTHALADAKQAISEKAVDGTGQP